MYLRKQQLLAARPGDRFRVKGVISAKPGLAPGLHEQQESGGPLADCCFRVKATLPNPRLAERDQQLGHIEKEGLRVCGVCFSINFPELLMPR
jgi:hypothetical protein